MPSEADTTQNNGVTLTVAELGSFYLQFAVLLHGVSSMRITNTHTEQNNGQ